MNGLLHLSYFDVEFFLLVRNNLIKGVASLGKSNLEIDLSKLQLLFIVVHTGGKIFVEADDIVADLTHLVDRVVHKVDGIGIQRL